jgi:serine protease DegQ
VQNDNDLYNAEGIAPVDSALELKVLRGGTALTLNATLKAESIVTTEGAKLDARLDGADISDAGERIKRAVGTGGVIVNKIVADSRAAENGLQVGDFIIGVNRVDVGGMGDFRKLLATKPRQLLLSVVRGREAFFLPLR